MSDETAQPGPAEEPPADPLPESPPPPHASEPAGDPGLPPRGGLRRFVHRPRSRRGFFALMLVVAGFAAAAALGTISAIGWTDTASFCGRCHQMGPELAAYDAGPHRDVACAECHVEPGIGGWIQAKLNGSRQLVEVLTGTFPTPIPPPDHSDLPSAQTTCLSCHSLSRLATTTLVTRTQFTADDANTPQFVALMIRPAGGDPADVERSVHWHVLQTVDYGTADPHAQTIDWVSVRRDDGSTETFVASNQVAVTDDATPDVDRLQAAEDARRMDCLDCHNRVGHPLPNPRREVDAAMSAGSIDPSLPEIKRVAMGILTDSYPTLAAADAAAASIRDFYELRYPTVAAAQASAIDEAVAQVQLIYRLAATPEMKVTATTYPDNLGHTDFPGCFRCHDGAHFKVVDGQLSSEAIPFTCDTCHTFPQIGGVTSLPMGEAPESHSDGLWVFNHNTVATAEDPGGTSCGACHSKDYCVNCHQTGAVQVSHSDMLLNHAKVTNEVGANACAYCHQPAYCARCHADPVLPGGNQGLSLLQEAGMRWPLVASAGGSP
jgi:nitrate/TMAO reductase-like tetraheme cytochrome c subunit